MNAIELLKQDHRAVLDLFKAHEAAGDRAMTEKRTIGDKIFKELEVHTQIEEEIFYPAARGAATEQTEKLVPEAYEEHKVAKNLISGLRATPVESEEWDAKMKVLSESIDHHVKEEQNELFPEVQKTLGNAYLRELGEKMEARKRELSGTAPSMGGTLVKMVTRAYDSLTGNSKPARSKQPKTAAKRPASAKSRTTKKTASKSTAKALTRGATAAKRVARSAKAATTRRVQSGTKKVKARVSAARTRVAKVVKGSRKSTKKGRRSARR